MESEPMQQDPIQGEEKETRERKKKKKLHWKGKKREN